MTEPLPDPNAPRAAVGELSRALRDAFGRFATGVTLVTAPSEIGPIGITANSFSSVSLDPPLILWSPARASRRFEAFASAEHFAVHVLRSDQLDLARAFTHHGTAFDGTEMTLSEDGVPRLDDVLARFDCVRHAIHDGGDHAIIVGRITEMTAHAGAPLIFSGGRYGDFSAF